jgi:hypothetical protein
MNTSKKNWGRGAEVQAVAHACNPSTQVAEAGILEPKSFRPVWETW